MTRMTGPDCAVMCNLVNTHTHTHTERDNREIREEKRREEKRREEKRREEGGVASVSFASQSAA